MSLRVALDARPAAGLLTGVGLGIVRLVEYLSGQGVQCDLLYDRVPSHALEGSGIRSVVIEPTGHGRGGWEQIQLPAALHRLKPDLYHATWNYGVPLRSPCPAVLTVHDLIPLALPEAFPHSLGGRISRIRHWVQMLIATRRARLIMAVSRFTAADLARLLSVPSTRVRVVLQGVDRPSADEISREAIAACQSRYRLEPPFLIYVGGMDRRKNLEGLLRAYKTLRQQRAAPSLVVVGAKIAQYEELQRLVNEMDLSAGVLFTGHVPQADLWPLLAGAEMLVYPSLYEGFGLPPLEAMACGTPVVTSNVSSIPEIVGDAALLVNPRNHLELANTIERLLEDRDLQDELVRRGKERIQEFSWQKYGSCVLSIYREIAGQR